MNSSSMEEPRIGNYSSCCRLCLSEKYNSLNNIFTGYSDADALVEKICSYLGVQINTTDKLSTMLCEGCFGTLNKWEGFRKQCIENQIKIQKWHDNWNDNMASVVKDEPVEEFSNEIINLDDEEDVVNIKPEPIDAADDEFTEIPPMLPQMVETVLENGDASSNDQLNLSDRFVLNRYSELSTQCSVCDKVLSNPGNRKKHEKFMHGLYGGYKNHKRSALAVAVDNRGGSGAPQNTSVYPQISSISSKNSPVISHVSSKSPSDTPPLVQNGQATEKEKIQFAAGLQLQSISDPMKYPNLTKIEVGYLDKCKIMVTMFIKNMCTCHSQRHPSQKKMLGHMRQVVPWFPPYTCYNCMATYDGRSMKMRHTPRCPRQSYEYLIRIAELKDRPDSKFRIYQSHKCIKCNYFYNFYEDYCDHVDNEHVLEEGPWNCMCSESFETVDSYREHIHKNCYLHYYCDICFFLCPTLEDFKNHCTNFHDNQENFQFFNLHPQFEVLSDKEITEIAVRNQKDMELDYVEPEPQEADTSQEPETPETNRRMRKRAKYTLEDVPVLEPDGLESLKTSPNPNAYKYRPTKCTDCEKVYSSWHNMVRHLKSFHGKEEPPPPFTQVTSACDICGNEFTNYYNMLRHRKLHTEDLKKILCPQCPEKFRLNSELKDHIHSVHADLINSNVRNVRSSFKCEDCGKSFRSVQMLENHQEEDHPFTCHECGKQCNSTVELEHHRSVHLNITLTRDPDTKHYRSVSTNMCQICDKSFETDAELHEHMLLHEDMPTLDMEGDVKNVRTYQCVECDKMYAGARGLWVHNKRFHPERSSKNMFPKDCPQCDRTLTTMAAWVMHKRTHDGTSKKMFNLPPSSVMYGENDAEEDYHTCKKCFKVFASKSNLKVHMKSHGINIPAPRSYLKTGKFVKTFWCDICHQACAGMTNLNKHKMEHRIEDNPELANQMVEVRNRKPVICRYCKLAFESPEMLSEHMINEHVEEPKPKTYRMVRGKYACDICNKLFSSASALSSHQGWHKRPRAAERVLKRDEKLYRKIELKQEPVISYNCQTCMESFSSDPELQMHILEAHRKIDATLTYKCYKCNLNFSSQAEFANHDAYHKHKENKKGVICKYCQKVFSRSDYLNIHIAKKHPQYAVVGTFRCNLCDRVFERQNALNIHLKVHERVKGNLNKPQNAPTPPPTTSRTYKYSCSICHLGFDIPKELRNHIISTHPF